MPFVFIDVSYLRHPKLRGVSGPARLLHLASILWTAEHLTDGFVPVTALRQLYDDANIAARHGQRHVVELTTGRLWEQATDGFLVHDFADHNWSSTRAVVEANRLANRERQRRKRAHDRGSVTP